LRPYDVSLRFVWHGGHLRLGLGPRHSSPKVCDGWSHAAPPISSAHSGLADAVALFPFAIFPCPLKPCHCWCRKASVSLPAYALRYPSSSFNWCDDTECATLLCCDLMEPFLGPLTRDSCRGRPTIIFVMVAECATLLLRLDGTTPGPLDS
jgi:hypothetical protein